VIGLGIGNRLGLVGSVGLVSRYRLRRLGWLSRLLNPGKSGVLNKLVRVAGRVPGG
jgi:hypothetical protein